MTFDHRGIKIQGLLGNFRRVEPIPAISGSLLAEFARKSRIIKHFGDGCGQAIYIFNGRKKSVATVKNHFGYSTSICRDYRTTCGHRLNYGIWEIVVSRADYRQISLCSEFFYLELWQGSKIFDAFAHRCWNFPSKVFRKAYNAAI